MDGLGRWGCGPCRLILGACDYDSCAAGHAEQAGRGVKHGNELVDYLADGEGSERVLDVGLVIEGAYLGT